jgi:hypothetical protein
MKCKIYATDEGFGPLIRQSAIIDELRLLEPNIDITFQTHRHMDSVGLFLKDVTLVDKENNIRWDKHPDGSPDVPAIKRFLSDYEDRSDRFIREELDVFDYDFIISDFVYEAFPVAQQKMVPVYGVAHFTWDWFFSKLYPLPVTNGLLERLTSYANMADVLYFPPFTPREILRQYPSAKEVPLVVRKNESAIPGDLDVTKFNVLIIDSGSEVLMGHMKQALKNISELTDFHFFLSADLGVVGDNVTKISKKELFIDYIPHVDLVIARAGFNTISECIAFRTPILLVGEVVNPEISENMMNVKHEGLGSFISLEKFTGHFNKMLPHFVKYEFPSVLQAVRSHEISSDGAKVIAQDILNRVSRKMDLRRSHFQSRLWCTSEQL